MKRIRGETNWHYSTYEHGNITRKLPCSYLYLKQAKMSHFSFIFNFFLLQNWRTGPAQEGRVGKCKNETIPGIRHGIKESNGGGKFKYDIFGHCKNFCKYHNVPPPSTTIKEKKDKK
jgi:hypothetical protein